MKVERQHRLRLTQEIVGHIPWLAAANVPVSVYADVGDHGEVRVFAPSSRRETEYRQLVDRLTSMGPTEDPSSAIVTLARYTANVVQLTFSRERNRVTVVLPRELRALGAAPSKGEDAVVFAFGREVEIWRADILAKHLRSLDRKLEDLLEESSDDIAGQE